MSQLILENVLENNFILRFLEFSNSVAHKRSIDDKLYILVVYYLLIQ